ncbi:putative Bromodomain [Blattamonas nauphoetae]|uniref:Bromodomain n=1 Tax=Blattamonas nauphoetae TaxID=2049346 RepID=A0ABQ9WR15_9EUKA|nr:putative Bromodomain [Blattamonas nauphoetae]
MEIDSLDPTEQIAEIREYFHHCAEVYAWVLQQQYPEQAQSQSLPTLPPLPQVQKPHGSRPRRSTRTTTHSRYTHPYDELSSSSHQSNQPPPNVITQLNKLKFAPNVPLQMKYMAYILRDLIKIDVNKSFSIPVDPILLGCPTYFDVIKKPKDLGTIKTDIENGEYSHPREVIDDVQLVWDNCRKFNGPTHPIIAACDKLNDEADKRFSKLQEWVMEMRNPTALELDQLHVREQRWIRSQADVAIPYLVPETPPESVPPTTKQSRQAEISSLLSLVDKINEIAALENDLTEEEQQTFLEIVGIDDQASTEEDVSIDLYELSSDKIDALYEFTLGVKRGRLADTDYR